ncbi:MAG TPA: protein-disulfide reductase DsbD domain-containing protein [Usitatibacter sp.]|nr:protein-disulfide reductase DsbD domain-containing protein [Usitatibacter sp.]
MSSSFPALRAALAFAALLAPFAASSEPVVKTEHVEAQLVTEKAAAKPGSTFVVGLRLRMEPQWHTYWINPGDSGLPTKIKWTLPAGWKAGNIQWPYPQKLPVGPLMNYGYEDEVILLTDISVPADAAAGSANLKADVEWLVCKDICIPEKGALDLSVPIATAQPADDPRYQAGIDRARNQLPVDPSGWKYDAAIVNGMLAVRLTAPEGSKPPANLFFFPERENLIDPAAPEKFTRDGRSVTVEMKLADPPLANVQSVKGVAFSEGGWQGSSGRKAIEVAANVGASLPGAVAGTTGGGEIGASVGGSALAALAFAFIGGILLNLMPCVFPVLGIKVMGFVEHAHGDERAMRLQGIVFGAGVLVSFLVLAGLMLAMRAGGAQLGWGFQLQSPAFVMVLAVLFFVLALNLSGVFEWGAFAQSMTSNLSARGRYADAFLSGVLATVVATPCTAPFMGAAVGFTLTQDAALSLVVFAVLGIGMAIPVVMLSFFPGLLRKLPKPGAWMETFKQVLAFPLYATVAWLAWVIGAQAGNDAILALLGGLVLVAMGAWAYGRWAASTGFAHTVFAAMLVAAGVAVAWPSSHPQGAETAAADEAGWEAWSPEKVRSLTAQGHAVFVDFTAAWCVTCQVNKRLALHNADVVKAFAARDIVRLKADWTRQDPRITAALAELGRNAVPVYALYVPGEDKPRLLPEVLTPSLVLGEIARLPAGKGATAVTQR